jgi:signal transduction histidine kinase
MRTFLKRRSISTIHMIVMSMIFLLILSVVGMGLIAEYNQFNEEADRIQKRYIQKQKESIVFDVNRVLKFIVHIYATKKGTQSQESLKEQIIHVIEELYGRPDGTGYIFIYDFNGTVLSDPVQRENIGKNLYTIQDSNGVEVIKDLIDVSKEPDGGFVEYVWLKPTTGQLSPKVSFARSFKSWGWMIGTGVYLDEIEKSIATQRNQLNIKLNHYMRDMFFLLAILFSFGMIGMIISKDIIRREIDTLNRFFHDASTAYSLIDPQKIDLVEFKRIITPINRMVKIIQQREKRLRELNSTLEKKVEAKTKDLHKKNSLLTQEKNFSNSLLKAQDSFIKHAIHEINTPLAVIMTHIDLFRITHGENRYLSKIEAGSKTIATIYEDLSYMVKKDRFIYTPSTINFSQFLLERVDFFAEIIRGNNHHITLDIQPNLTIYISQEELQRVIDNNLSNAIKYGYKDTPIVLSLKEKGETILLSFLTHSPKIHDTQAIFAPFTREDTIKGGFGLGLEIVYTICQKYAITIEVSSDEDQTIFCYTFNKEPQDARTTSRR